jgi:hypothetical protein
MNDNIVTKSAVSVTEMARMVGLSRARFYQLVRRGTFPQPDEDPLTKRPFFSEEKQCLILDARRRNCGVDGVVVMFYSRRKDFGQTKAAPRPTKPKATSDQHAELMILLRQVKVTATVAQVERVVKELFPEGTEGIDLGVVFKAVQERLRCKNSSGDDGGK